MKKQHLLLSMLGLSCLAYAQEKPKDSLNTRSIDQVIINSVVKKDTETSNKMPLKFIENPQVFSSIDKTVLENQNIYTVDRAFNNVTGLQVMWNATNRSGDGGAYVNLRGFTSSNSMRNGMVSPVTGRIDAINVEKVEVLKGPSATIFGSGTTSYGGVINRVTKKPMDKFTGSVSLAGGSYDFFRVQTDINTPVDKNKKLLFRVNTAFTTESNFQNKAVQNQYYAFAPSLTWNINDQLSLDLEYENFESKYQAEQVYFFSFPPSDYNLKNMKDLEKLGLDYNQSYLGGGLYNYGKNRNIIGKLSYHISDKIKSTTFVSNSYSYSDGYNPYFYISTATSKPDGSPLGLFRGDQSTKDSKQSFFQVQQNFNFDFNLGAIHNRLLIGGDYMHTNSNQLFIYEDNIDFVPFAGGNYKNFNKEYVQGVYSKGNFGSYPMVFNKDTYSAYISDVMSFSDALKAMASIRYENNKFLDGILGSPVTPYQQAAFSPKFGLVYELIKHKFSIFGNYQNSFKSNGYYVADKNGTTALSKPEMANQLEGGLKMNLLNGRLNATLSYYDIKVKNTLQTIGYGVGNIPVKNQAGEMESKGVEMEVNAYLVRGFSLIAGVSYNDSKITQTTDESVLGRRPDTASSPWLANFNATYQFLDGNLKGLGLGLGGNYASANRIINTKDAVFELPKYFVMNANLFYDTKKIRVGVSVNNLTNEKYWIGYTTANPQKPLHIGGNLTYKF